MAEFRATSTTQNDKKLIYTYYKNSNKYSVIDNNKNIEYRVSKADAARIIGISTKQIGRWKEKAFKEGRNREHFNHFEILFTEFEEVKSNKGFKLNPDNIYKS